MKFKRNLKRKLIDKLNGLYEDRNSWWRKIVDDKDVFILIRNNRLHVLANGGLFLQAGPLALTRAKGTAFQILLNRQITPHHA